jgi:Ca2+-binding RTX toxin-like protein
MANYLFSVDGEETGTVGGWETAFVYNLDFFDTTDKVTCDPDRPCTLAFDIGGDIDLDLTGYAGITDFYDVTARSATGGVHLTIGQDFYLSNGKNGGFSAESLSNGAVVLDASALTGTGHGRQPVTLEARSDGFNVLIGGAYDDFLTGGRGADRFDGGDGNDSVNLYGSREAVTVDLAAGTGRGGDADGDTYISIETINGTAFDDRITGGAKPDDHLYGQDGNDVLSDSEGYVFGGSGDDVLIVSGAVTRCYGGPGIDQVNFQIDPDGAVIDLLHNDVYVDQFAEIENVYGSGSNDSFYGDVGSNVLEGVGGDDELNGRDGNDVLRGGAGGDVLHGGAGADLLDGGGGSDLANYQGSAAAVVIDLLDHTASGGDAAGDTLTGIENLYGSSHDDHLTGDAGRNVIGGELGDDTLVGNGGDDAMNGENGNDSLDGGDGNDRLVGGAGSDTIHGGTGADSIDAGSENDIIFGGAGNDSLYGGTGNDQIDGGDGNDILEGAAGADALTGGEGLDTASYASSAAGVTVSLATGAGLGGDAQGDTLTGIENLAGSAQADHLTGDETANVLSGGAGDDVLTGGVGADLLKGGAGNDSFRHRRQHRGCGRQGHHPRLHLRRPYRPVGDRRGWQQRQR